MRILVTGASGFLGRTVVERCQRDPIVAVRSAVRKRHGNPKDGRDVVQTGDLGAVRDWRPALTDVNVVIHTAARVHIMQENASDPLELYRHVNVEATTRLATAAASLGVRRFVFVSSVKVNGDATAPGRAYTPDDVPAAVDAYGASKWEAEQALLRISSATGMEVVIVRPVLIYGPGVKANFLAMMRWLQRGVPLPFAAVRNSRSLAFVENVADLIYCCHSHPAAVNQTFLVSDGEDLSTPELLRRTAQALGTAAHLVSVPPSLLVAALRLLRRPDIAQRLCGSLQVDIRKTRDLLDWTAPFSVDDALLSTARWFLESRARHR